MAEADPPFVEATETGASPIRVRSVQWSIPSYRSGFMHALTSFCGVSVNGCGRLPLRAA